MTLVEFLLARIAEDEGGARRVLSGYAQHSVLWHNPSTAVVDLGDAGIDGLLPTGDGPVATHIARWDPARVLAECEAKRQIIEWHQDWPFLVARARFGSEAPTGPVLRFLALPYADHPDWREEWRPVHTA